MYIKLKQYSNTKSEDDMVNWVGNKTFVEWEHYIKEKIKSERKIKKKAIMKNYWEYAFYLRNFIETYLSFENKYPQFKHYKMPSITKKEEQNEFIYLKSKRYQWLVKSGKAWCEFSKNSYKLD